MLKDYKTIILLGAFTASFSAVASSVPFGEYPNSHFQQERFPLDSFPAHKKPENSHFSSHVFSLSIDEENEHEEDEQEEHGFSGRDFEKLFGKNEGEHEEHNLHAHTNDHFPHDEFPHDNFPKHDFPSDHYPEKFDDYPYPWDEHNMSPVPIPASVWLFGSGLAGLAMTFRKKNGRNKK